MKGEFSGRGPSESSGSRWEALTAEVVGVRAVGLEAVLVGPDVQVEARQGRLGHEDLQAEGACHWRQRHLSRTGLRIETGARRTLGGRPGRSCRCRPGGPTASPSAGDRRGAAAVGAGRLGLGLGGRAGEEGRARATEGPVVRWGSGRAEQQLPKTRRTASSGARPRRRRRPVVIGDRPAPSAAWRRAKRTGWSQPSVGALRLEGEDR